jgi:hypothetical protein
MVIEEGILASAATWVDIPYVTELPFPGRILHRDSFE